MEQITAQDAVSTIPRFDQAQWQRMNRFTAWLVAMRAGVLIMTLFSFLLGLIYAAQSGAVDWVNALLCMAGLCLAHGCNNLINDLVDFRKGLDTDNYFRNSYGPQLLVKGFMSEGRFVALTVLTGSLALAAGLALVWRTDLTVLYYLLAGAFFVLFYTWPLKYFGLGEPAVLLVWGPLMIGGTYYTLSGSQPPTAILWLACLYAIGPTAVLFGKHIDKLQQDREKNVRTLPVLLGESLARQTAGALLLGQMALLIALSASGYFGYGYLLVALMAPGLIGLLRVFANPYPQSRPEGSAGNHWPLHFVARTFAYNRWFSLLFFAGALLNLAMDW
ncbi:prenyltransferase [Biformimicrobium ophioploci]|uniref:1,4-dihydroxy-2-naphthoate polyprenyltransferase n=1 Tax=Biformimicrobium ophioploci TaxID=3036711 RepID=A0ABQ6LYR9_9GAMM|nr:prenyltransferase [Microbulbifer sp. NKW57]GMG87238.1 1,4-dihydroxy-2-naphthoate polyprenyltransferase [Microbulbifer sp. NKW57]